MIRGSTDIRRMHFTWWKTMNSGQPLRRRAIVIITVRTFDPSKVNSYLANGVLGCVCQRSEAVDSAYSLLSGLAGLGSRSLPFAFIGQWVLIQSYLIDFVISYQRLLPATNLNLQGAVASMDLVSDIAFMISNTHEFFGWRIEYRGKDGKLRVSVQAARSEWTPSNLPNDFTRMNPYILWWHWSLSCPVRRQCQRNLAEQIVSFSVWLYLSALFCR